ncbi:MAG: hypothetical protein RMN25_11470 [Anaerolineae bacterium]|nr:hypothetical protein [Thermoflexales bacterium]MDW8408388.1 hypothetical protein [Anaerolineae bacterium]
MAMKTRKLSRSQIVFYVLTVLVILSMVISAFASILTGPTVNTPVTRPPATVAPAER